jgi:hypothetical protein
MRIKIIGLHQCDGYYRSRESLIGLEGDFEEEKYQGMNYYAGVFTLDEPITLSDRYGTFDSIKFLAVEFIKLDDKSKELTGPATKVKCTNNTDYEGLISPGRNYKVEHESEKYYHLITDKKYLFFFPKDNFIRIA